MITALLILHGLVAVALLGAITHQLMSAMRKQPAKSVTFADRYVGVSPGGFAITVVALFATSVVLGGVIYPSYRLDVRIPFEDMSLAWAVGLFEIKEHFGGVGLGVLPLYAYAWRADSTTTHRGDRIATTAILAFIVWWDFLVGHVLNNIRGLG